MGSISVKAARTPYVSPSCPGVGGGLGWDLGSRSTASDNSNDDNGVYTYKTPQDAPVWTEGGPNHNDNDSTYMTHTVLARVKALVQCMALWGAELQVA